jgi:tRNA modification GTPase
MKLDLERTIVAVSSGSSPARRTIVRISGNATREILQQLSSSQAKGDASGEAGQALLQSRSASSGTMMMNLGWGSRELPVRVYFWPDRRSFTGEPCAELHLLGSPPLVEALVERILSMGAVAAERGEFTLRAFLAGKLDLTQAEAVLGVIESDCQQQLQDALGRLSGNLSMPLRALRNELIELIAHMEAGLDFVEEDIQFLSEQELERSLTQIEERLAAISSQLNLRNIRTRSAEVVLVGLPNAGKSSLFNALVGRERAIVSSIVGTTRDALTEKIAVQDLSIELVDTAGLEEAEDVVSPRGLAQVKLQERLRRADVLVLCVDLADFPAEDWVERQRAALRSYKASVLTVGTKADLASPVNQHVWDVVIDLRQPEGLAELKQSLLRLLKEREHYSQSAIMHEASVRCRGSIDQARISIASALTQLCNQQGEELIVAELRHALDDMCAVIGEVHNEDILGEIFSRFCIGK